MSDKTAVIAGVVVMLCCSSSFAAVMMMGGDDTKSTGPSSPGPSRSPGPSGPVGTPFHASTLPPTSEATIIDVGEFGWGQTYNVPASQGDSAPWYLQLQTDGNIVWVRRGTGTQWSLGSHTTMPATKGYLQGDGNICAYGNGGSKCTMSHDPNVPSGQHKLVLKTNGEMYIDHGTGVASRSYIHRP